MDPYKLLNVKQADVKNPSDLDKVRHKAHVLFKRHAKKKEKFEAKKVLEAFQMIKMNFGGKLGEGSKKILGRSRKERDLDKHFNHQTKEIKKNKELKITLKRARHGDQPRFRLPGDKERVARPHRKSKRRRRTKVQKPAVGPLDALNRLAAVLPQQAKFPKVIKLLYRWMKEYLNMDNRGYVFAVLHGIVNCEFLVEDVDARLDIVQVFEYTRGYFSKWVEESDQNRMLVDCWDTSAVQACKCYTDDPFVLSSTIAKLNEALKLIEDNKEQLVERERQIEIKKEEAFFSTLTKKEEEVKEEVKAERDKKPLMSKPLIGMAAPVAAGPEKKEDAKKSAKDEEKSKVEPVVLGPMASPAGSDDAEVDLIDSGSDGEIAIDSGDEICALSEDEVLSLGSGDDDEGIELDSDLDSFDDMNCECEISSGEISAGESSGDVEEIETPAFVVPTAVESVDMMRTHFVERCLYALFSRRGPLWARPKIDAFFQDVFYRRGAFTPKQQLQIEGWQSNIKTNQKLGERAVGETNNPMESHRPVIDSRETRTLFDADSNNWAAKQTFDSREASAGKVIR